MRNSEGAQPGGAGTIPWSRRVQSRMGSRLLVLTACPHIAFSSDEIRTLRQGDINLTHQIVAVNRKAGKNKHRRREVPLTDAAAVLGTRAASGEVHRLAGKSPETHLFPIRVARNRFDGEFHMGETGIRKQFEAVRDAAGVPWFRLNGWRHTAITRMAEAGIPIATIMARAGHCSPKMTAHYTHISMQAERMAMQSMTHGRRATPRPPERPPQAPPINMMDPAILAEIDRRSTERGPGSASGTRRALLRFGSQRTDWSPAGHVSGKGEIACIKNRSNPELDRLGHQFAAEAAEGWNRELRALDRTRGRAGTT